MTANSFLHQKPSKNEFIDYFHFEDYPYLALHIQRRESKPAYLTWTPFTAFFCAHHFVHGLGCVRSIMADLFGQRSALAVVRYSFRPRLSPPPKH